MCSEGLISKITVVDLSELDAHIEEIQWLFDDPVSIEALVGDYIAAYAELGESPTDITAERMADTVAGIAIADYEDGSIFATLTSEHKDSVIQTLRQVFQVIAALLADNGVDLDDVPAWQLVGLRGTNHVVLAQAKTGLTHVDIQNVVHDIQEEKNAH